MGFQNAATSDPGWGRSATTSTSSRFITSAIYNTIFQTQNYFYENLLFLVCT